MSKLCYKCNGEQNSPLNELFGYTICEACIKDLGLLTAKTIKRHFDNRSNYFDETKERLEFVEKKYRSSKVKLLHILEQIENLKHGK